MTAWTAEEDAILIAGITEGKSYATLASEMGKTRSTIAGRAARLQERADGKLWRPRKVEKAKPEEKPQGILFKDLDWWQCKYGIAEDEHGRHLFCGKPRRQDKPYCPEHCDIAYCNSSAPEEDGAITVDGSDKVVETAMPQGQAEISPAPREMTT